MLPNWLEESLGSDDARRPGRRAGRSIGVRFNAARRGPEHESSVPDKQMARDDAPGPAVERIETIVAEDEVAIGRDALRAHAARYFTRWQIGFRQRVPADDQPSVLRIDEIAADCDDPLDHQLT